MGQYERITGKTSWSINMFYITMGIVTFFILVNLGISKYKTADDRIFKTADDRIEAAVKPAIENQTVITDSMIRAYFNNPSNAKAFEDKMNETTNRLDSLNKVFAEH